MTIDYRVVLKDKTEFKVTADDVDLDSCRPEDEEDKCLNHWFNFTREEVTVAAVPFDLVLYISK